MKRARNPAALEERRRLAEGEELGSNILQVDPRN
jgi:hypothetical protein